MRMTASWSGSNDPTAYESVARRYAHLASSPRILNRPTQPTDQTPNRINAKSPVQFIVAPRAQVSRRGETQAPLGGKPAKLCYRFGPLTPSARSANLIAGNETKKGFPAPNKEHTKNQKQ